MSEILGYILSLAGIVLFGATIALLLSPLETLGWWAGWFGEHPQPEKPLDHPAVLNVPAANDEIERQHFVVFLDGIAKATGQNYADVQDFLERLARQLPDTVVLGDLFPYAVTNHPLTEHRPLSRFWRFALDLKLSGRPTLLGFSINIRNLLQVAVSADRRYGPIYHQGEARLILRDLLMNGYKSGSGVPITLIGYSGGGQIALGVTPYLKRILHAPVDIISLGGVMSSDRGLRDVRHLYYLAGSKDVVQRLGAVFFPGRWPILPHSSWNQLVRQGRFSSIPMGPIGHNGKGSYVDAQAFLADGSSFIDHTVKVVSDIICQHSPHLHDRELLYITDI